MTILGLKHCKSHAAAPFSKIRLFRIYFYCFFCVHKHRLMLYNNKLLISYIQFHVTIYFTISKQLFKRSK